MKNCARCGLNSPSVAEICPFCGFSFVVREFDLKTRPFREMYQVVTDKLKKYLNDPNNVDKLTSAEKEWFNYLIDAFWRDYRAWERGEPKLVDYLHRFHEGRFTPRVFQFVGHAYLHIAYDLPRDIANSLSNNTYPYDKKDKFDESIPPAINLHRAKGIYLKQAPAFLELMEESARNRSVTGFVGLLSKLIPKKLELFRSLGNWILALRNAAWMHGETLKDVGPHKRQELEEKLLDAVNQASKDVIGYKWNPFAWPSRLQSPTSLLLMAIVIQGRESILPLLSDAYFGIGLFIFLALLYLWFLYEGLIRYTNYLGEAVYYYTTRAMAIGVREEKQQ